MYPLVGAEDMHRARSDDTRARDKVLVLVAWVRNLAAVLDAMVVLVWYRYRT